jgi:putative transposase
MDEYESLCHTKWECKYHVVVFIPKSRRKTLYAQLRKDLGEVFDGWRSRRKAGSRRGI